ncbi:hypothetical protein DRP07_08305, partial [Archaeoglobales archaeon]
MREDNLLCIKRTFKPVTTDSNHKYRKYPNLLKDLEVNRINQVWAADITYIRLQREHIYGSNHRHFQQEMRWMGAGKELRCS